MSLVSPVSSGFIQSPLNYTGGKHRLLPQIMPLFPKRMDVFVDLFCGGGNVGVNARADKVILNDMNGHVVGLLKAFKDEGERFLSMVDGVIRKYGLSQSAEYGYGYYGCDSSRGLATYNRAGFLRLREDFNAGRGEGLGRRAMLYTLITFSFNNQIRFNGKGEFNLPVGKRDFNGKMRDKFKKFAQRLNSENFELSSMDYADFNISALGPVSFVYIDPPYLIACAEYNENGGWDEEKEKALLAFLDKIDRRGVKFALSNVIRNKNRHNTILLEWLDRRKYKVTTLSFDYNNANYHSKNKNSVTEEVLIVNY